MLRRFGWECYFRPLSNCTMQDAWEPWTTDMRDDYHKDWMGYMYKHDYNASRVQYYGNIDGPWQNFIHDKAHSWGKQTPPAFAHRGHKWWRSQLSRYIIRPKAFVLRHIAARARAIRFDPAAVGMHIRHGDKSYDVVHQGSHFGSIGSYISRAQLLLRKHPHKDFSSRAQGKFFVATDDDAVVQEAMKVGKKAQVDGSTSKHMFLTRTVFFVTIVRRLKSWLIRKSGGTTARMCTPRSV